jgi:hypothetical protein
MNRRGFLQALFAIPVLAAPLLQPTRLHDVVYVGPGYVARLSTALETVKPGGVVYVMPGHSETLGMSMTLPAGTHIVGMRSQRPSFTWHSPPSDVE